MADLLRADVVRSLQRNIGTASANEVVTTAIGTETGTEIETQIMKGMKETRRKAHDIIIAVDTMRIMTPVAQTAIIETATGIETETILGIATATGTGTARPTPGRAATRKRKARASRT